MNHGRHVPFSINFLDNLKTCELLKTRVRGFAYVIVSLIRYFEEALNNTPILTTSFIFAA